MRDPESRRRYKTEWERKFRLANPELAKARYKERRDRYTKKHSERIKVLAKARRLKNPEIHRKYCRDWYARNLEKRRIVARKYYHSNRRQCIQTSVLSQKKHWVKIKAQRRNKYATDPRYRVTCQLRNRLRAVLKRIKIPKSRSTLSLLGCSREFLKGYLEGQFQKGMTWDNYGKWHVDHVFPCVSFDLTKPEEQQRCFHYTNLQPLWGVENNKKYDTVPMSHQPNLI